MSSSDALKSLSEKIIHGIEDLVDEFAINNDDLVIKVEGIVIKIACECLEDCLEGNFSYQDIIDQIKETCIPNIGKVKSDEKMVLNRMLQYEIKKLS